jgi:hypothetical protein
MSEGDITKKIENIEQTMVKIFAEAAAHTSTHAAAIAYANAKITSGSKMKAPPPTAKVPT